jgi:hypothetical protein
MEYNSSAAIDLGHWYFEKDVFNCVLKLQSA